MATKVQAQLAIDERVIEDPDLEAALELRQKRKEELEDPKRAYTEADTAAKALLQDVIEVGEIGRIGRFRLERKATAARSVSFEAGAGERITISVQDEE